MTHPSEHTWTRYRVNTSAPTGPLREPGVLLPGLYVSAAYHWMLLYPVLAVVLWSCWCSWDQRCVCIHCTISTEAYLCFINKFWWWPPRMHCILFSFYTFLPDVFIQWVIFFLHIYKVNSLHQNRSGIPPCWRACRFPSLTEMSPSIVPWYDDNFWRRVNLEPGSRHNITVNCFSPWSFPFWYPWILPPKNNNSMPQLGSSSPRQQHMQ